MYEPLIYYYMRPSATSVRDLTLLVYEALRWMGSRELLVYAASSYCVYEVLRYSCLRTNATSACGLYEVLS